MKTLLVLQHCQNKSPTSDKMARQENLSADAINV